MAEFTSHTPGTFSWVELATTDQKGGVAFYTSLFGWGVNDIPMGPDGVYSMFTLGGKEVGAGSTLRDDERQMGIPSHWNLYVTVANVDETTALAKSLGGNVLAPPFDVMDAGRMAVLQDPTGAAFQIWQAGRSIGAKVLYEAGALCWSELATRDTAAAEKFYTALFGWTAKHAAPGAPMQYTEFSVGGKPSVGMMGMPAGVPAGVPSFWTAYFQVDDCDASTARAVELGGTAMLPPTDIPGTGRFSVVTDPQGANFALFTRKA